MGDLLIRANVTGGTDSYALFLVNLEDLDRLGDLIPGEYREHTIWLASLVEVRVSGSTMCVVDHQQEAIIGVASWATNLLSEGADPCFWLLDMIHGLLTEWQCVDGFDRRAKQTVRERTEDAASLLATLRRERDADPS